MAKNDFRLISVFKIIFSFSLVLWENINVSTQKISVYFLYSLFKWKEVKPTSISNKYVENEIFNSTSHKNEGKKWEEQKHNPTLQT